LTVFIAGNSENGRMIVNWKPSVDIISWNRKQAN